MHADARGAARKSHIAFQRVTRDACVHQGQERLPVSIHTDRQRSSLGGRDGGRSDKSQDDLFRPCNFFRSGKKKNLAMMHEPKKKFSCFPLGFPRHATRLKISFTLTDTTTVNMRLIRPKAKVETVDLNR